MDVTPVKALVIDGKADDFELLRATFAEAGAAEFEFLHSPQLSHALQLLDMEDFDIIILDLELPDSKGLDTLTQTYRRAPDLPIVVLTGIDDDGVALTAAQAGAEEYLVKGQASGGMLVRTVRYAIERRRLMTEQLRAAQEEEFGKTVGFIGAKGGTGTTTVASNIAAALAQNERRVTLLELRPDYGTLSLQLNRTPSENLSNLLRVSVDQVDKQEMERRLFNLPYGPRVLFGPQSVEEFMDIEPEQASMIIKLLNELSDYAVIDLPTNPSAATQLAVRLCDYVCLVTQPTVHCVRAGRMKLDQLQEWDVARSHVGAVVVTTAPTSGTLQLTEIERQLDCRIIGVMPPAGDACNSSMEAGMPLVLYQPEQVAAVTLTEMAQRLLAPVIEPMQL